MKNIYIRIIAILLSFISLSSHATEMIKVGMSGRYYPFTFLEKNELKGFEVDLWKEIGKRINLKPEFVTSNFSGLFGMLEAGKIDTISNQISLTEARKQKYEFTMPYVIDGAQVVVKKGRKDIKGITDLINKKVAVNLGSNFEQLLRKEFEDKPITIRTYDTGIELEVALGRMDAFVMDRVSAAQSIKTSRLPLSLAGEPFAKIENAMPFLRTQKQIALKEKVNNALMAMKKDGTLKNISNRWFDTDITN